jgi:glycerol-3-phosphate O-acyltransferase
MESPGGFMLERALTLPLWLFTLLLIAAVYAMVMSVLFPSVRWFFRRRLNRAVDRINDSLHITIKPFQRTRRQILIDQLIFDPEVIATIEEIARETGKPREVLQAEVKRYARGNHPFNNSHHGTCHPIYGSLDFTSAQNEDAGGADQSQAGAGNRSTARAG